MAGKARRAAARQGQLSRRRKKGQRGPIGVPANPITTDGPERDNGSVHNNGATEDGAPAEALNGPAAVAVPAPAVASRTGFSPRTARADAAPRGPGRLRGERPAAYNYVGAELRRIGLLSVSVIAVLIVLGFLL